MERRKKSKRKGREGAEEAAVEAGVKAGGEAAGEAAEEAGGEVAMWEEGEIAAGLAFAEEFLGTCDVDRAE